MMPLYMNFWHVVNMNRCPPQKGGCGKNILVCAKPVEVNLEQKLPTSPDVDLNQFIKEVEHFYIRQLEIYYESEIQIGHPHLRGVQAFDHLPKEIISFT